MSTGYSREIRSVHDHRHRGLQVLPRVANSDTVLLRNYAESSRACRHSEQGQREAPVYPVRVHEQKYIDMQHPGSPFDVLASP